VKSRPKLFWRGKAPLVLASASPRRVTLLRQAGAEFAVVDPGPDRAWPGEAEPRHGVRALALDKARRVVHAMRGINAIQSGDLQAARDAFDAALAIDASAGTIRLHVPVPGRGAELGLAVNGDAVWIASRAEILKVDAATGDVLARIPGDATAVAAVDGVIYAKRGIELLVIDPATGTIRDYLTSFPSGTPLRTVERVIWTAGPPGGGNGEVVAFDTAARATVARGDIHVSVLDLAVAAGQVWIASDESDSIIRFAVP